MLHALYAGLLALWVGTEILGFDNPGIWWWWHLPGGAYTLPLLVLPGLLWAYRKQSAMTVAIYAPLLAWWAILQPIAWRWQVNPIYFVGLGEGPEDLQAFSAETYAAAVFGVESADADC